MPKEIERKFLVTGETWRTQVKRSSVIIQGYFSHSNPTIRVRIFDGDEARITIKSLDQGITKYEFEYPVPIKDACNMINLYCGKRYVIKRRYYIKVGEHTWEVDHIMSPIDIVIAEVELSDPDEKIVMPRWIGDEVSEDPEHTNFSLALKQEEKWKS